MRTPDEPLFVLVEGEGPIVATAIHDGHALRDECHACIGLDEETRLREEDPYTGRIAEVAPTRELWATPLHPYTEALIGAVPRADGGGTLPEALPGEVPDPSRPPTGCRFHPRCPYAFERCPSEEPPLVGLAPRRSAACWLQLPGEPPLPPAAKAPRVAPAATGE